MIPRERRSVALVLLASALFAPLSAAPAAAQTAADEQPKRIAIYDELQYRPGESAAWRLDLAMPENFGGELHPAIVIIHGGGWRSGSRRDRPYRSMLTEYALKGYVTLSIDYRLLGEAPMEEMIEDVDCAVRWLRAHANDYKVDPNRIGVYGHSAGAHLALMLGVSPPDRPVREDSDCEWDQYSSQVTAVAGGSTPTYLPSQFGDSQLYSPSTYISDDMLPLLLVHGTEDRIVPVDSVDNYVAKVEAAGSPDVTYLRIEGGGHGVAYQDFMEPAMEAITEFFERTLGR